LQGFHFLRFSHSPVKQTEYSVPLFAIELRSPSIVLHDRFCERLQMSRRFWIPHAESMRPEGSPKPAPWFVRHLSENFTNPASCWGQQRRATKLNMKRRRERQRPTRQILLDLHQAKSDSGCIASSMSKIRNKTTWNQRWLMLERVRHLEICAHFP
jgi:hypothetical protein